VHEPSGIIEGGERKVLRLQPPDVAEHLGLGVVRVEDGMLEERRGARVAVVRIFHVGAFAEDGVGFIEKEDRVAGFGAIEHRSKILFGLADIARNDRVEIDLEEPHETVEIREVGRFVERDEESLRIDLAKIQAAFVRRVKVFAGARRALASGR